jgi:hypothetical protein
MKAQWNWQVRRPIRGGNHASTTLITRNILIDIDRSQALKITPKTIGGTDYLFIEAGGFAPKKPAAWQSPLMVMKRP